MKPTLSIAAAGLLISAFFSPATAQDGNQIAEGAKLWATNCTRCHNGRTSMERNDQDWTTIVLHMRARANLTRHEATAISVYLRATNAPETTVQVTGSAYPGRQLRQTTQAELASDILLISEAQLSRVKKHLRAIQFGDVYPLSAR